MVEFSPEVNCSYLKWTANNIHYEECIRQWEIRWQEHQKLLEQKRQEEYINSPEYKQQLLEKTQRDLEEKQRELEAKQAQLEIQLARAEYMNTVEKAKSSLWKKAYVVEIVAKKILEKDQKEIDKVLGILKTFMKHKNIDVKNIWIYLTYLLE